MIWFSTATLVPVLLLALAGLAGGLWPLVALIYMTGLTYFLDWLVQGAVVRTRDMGESGEFPTGTWLAIVLGIAHLGLLVLAVFAIGGESGLSGVERVLAFIGFGLFFGQVSNSNAHELIHKAARWPRRLGTLVFISLLFGHHASAHVRVHHIHVATTRDPNSARFGEGFYRFWPRAWIGSFVAGLRAETALRARSGRPSQVWNHPYVAYVGGAVACLLGAVLMGGWHSGAALVALAGYAQMQLILSDYVQHYGLERRAGKGDKPEPVGPQHSWNSPHFWTSALMLNAPRHSDHHLRPLRHFPELELKSETMPILPRSLPVMAAIAMLPPVWRKIMHPRLERLRETSHSGPAPLD